VVTGIRPGEKIHEILISEEEVARTTDRGRWYGIRPMLPEVSGDEPFVPCLQKEYSSGESVLSLEGTRALLEKNHLLRDEVGTQPTELLR
jgi:FlaA1/EpsC-like NDP-sugar epimerase